MYNDNAARDLATDVGAQSMWHQKVLRIAANLAVYAVLHTCIRPEQEFAVLFTVYKHYYPVHTGSHLHTRKLYLITRTLLMQLEIRISSA